ncbi:Mycocerosic acid synthase [Paraburkholderia ultramafica]|uniref:Mycocerosic acid synthase n=1 Tax=Paraburkholderia ultramafica TaxID=1544867 RepID=A0A6S7CYJ7_9BURK|nr:NAD(P)H-quinone oxidoreductase [Paraburkholderia ultramafica]CAB3791336.1 Mycocerosic acid synthase [Paraburkholderia ultramafica]
MSRHWAADYLNIPECHSWQLTVFYWDVLLIKMQDNHFEAIPKHQVGIRITAAGGPEVLVQVELSVLECGPTDVLIRVVSAGVNRHDVNQRRRGPDNEHSPIPGLEVSGVVVRIGQNVSNVRIGDEVCALVNGGGYAEYAIAEAGQVLPIPPAISLRDAASLPEALFTTVHNFFNVAKLARDESVLIHGGTSGVGSLATQVLTARGHAVYATCGTDEKCALAEALGAVKAFNYRTVAFAKAVQAVTAGKGVDVILDVAGAAYGRQNVEALARRGRVVHLSPGGNAELSFPLRELMRKEAVVTGSLLRPLPNDEKAGIARWLYTQVWPLIGITIKPMITQRFSLKQASAAHEALERGDVAGKILLDVTES